MKLSVALCTYNGAQYVAEQMMSIATQTRPPDELIVADDGSSDETLTVILRGNHVGIIANVERALLACTGEVIVLADQDDIWYEGKLEIIERAFLEDDSAVCLCTNAEIVNEHRIPLGYDLWECQGLRDPYVSGFIEAGRTFELLQVRHLATGATMAFRSSWTEIILPLPRDVRLFHDGWIALMAASVNGCRFLSDSLIQYRQHPEQHIGARLPVGTVKRLFEKPDIALWRRARWLKNPAIEGRQLERIASSLSRMGIKYEPADHGRLLVIS
jgi:glycosyltransferase involved in cell wall biosynthesis